MAGVNRRDVLEALPDETLIPVGFVRELLEACPRANEAGPTMLSVKETARRLGMSSTYVYDHSAEIGAVRYGRAIRFPADTVGAYLEELRRG